MIGTKRFGNYDEILLLIEFEDLFQISGDSISQSLEIARKFHAKQRDERKEALSKAIHKFTTVKPRDVLLYLVPEVRSKIS